MITVASKLVTSGVGLGHTPEFVYIKADKGELTLGAEQWEELTATMKGERGVAYSEEMDGYANKSIVVWSPQVEEE